jgi:hypothetical protein
MAGRERVGADLINAIQARFFVSESLPRLVEVVGVEACLAAGDRQFIHRRRLGAKSELSSEILSQTFPEHANHLAEPLIDFYRL